MKKLKIYIETSVISHLDAPDRPDWMKDTLRLWELIKAGSYEVFISPVVIAEVMGCAEPKRSFLLERLGEITYTELEETKEVSELAAQYLKAGIMPKKSNRDRQHVAYACVYNCDMVISWNFSHMVNYRTISGVKGVNALVGYREMLIYSPTILIEGGTDDDT
ncbi:MAG: PIN domain nuclease [Oscillospiraceae bacterium]|nr:PIN domain nuclease [Oscillospiraceae bacterium]